MVDAQNRTVLFETPLLEHRCAQRTARVTLRLRTDEDVVGVKTALNVERGMALLGKSFR